MHFEENQLSPSLIGLSPLVTAHPRTFQRSTVRSSNSCYRVFNLAITRSLGFGSNACNYTPYSDSLSLRLRNCCPLTLLHTITRRLILQKAHGQAWQAIALPYLVGIRFQVLFHSPPGVLFTFPSRYWFAIGHCLVFSLTKWSSRIPTEFHVLRGTQEITKRSNLTNTGLSPSMASNSRLFFFS
jgi:hypothetical protein